MENDLNSLWVASLFSQLGTAELEEFYLICSMLENGVRWSDPELAERSGSWRRLQLLFPQLLTDESRLSFKNEIRNAQERGIFFTYPSCVDFPEKLLNLREIPFFLSYSGTPIWLEKEGVAIVGSREPSDLSANWCEAELPRVLQELPIFSVSGGARGIDQIAHRISIRLQRPTVVLVPAGLLNLYPESLRELVSFVHESRGAFVSEFMPRVRMRKDFFQRRNRLISGFSLLCVIVEAKRQSGTLITARQAIEQGKPLLVLPSHPLDAGARGGLELIADGATPIRDAQDLLMYISAELKEFFWPKADVVSTLMEQH